MNLRGSIFCAVAAFLSLSTGCRSRSHNDQAKSSSTSATSAKYSLTIDPAQAGNIDEAKLRQATERAIELFESKISPLRDNLSIVVGASGCLRTGYSFTEKMVKFCANTNTPKSGTASEDVVHHELFHAMSCQINPTWCEPDFLKNDANVALQEGLADAFAHHLIPDEYFGEGFYDSAPYVRKYRSDACYNLVKGNHQKGNTIASLLISSNFDLSNLAAFFSGSSFTVDALVGNGVDACFTADGPKMDVVPENYPVSTLERFRIQKDLPLVLNFNPNDALKTKFSALKVRWESAPKLFSVEESTQANGSPKFTIKVTGDTGWEKATALYDDNGRIVGSESFYFTIKK